MRDVFDYRDLGVFQPDEAELPADIVGPGDAATVRVAKLDGVVLGTYRLQRQHGARFVLRALGVYAPYRGHGVGRWLLGHAVGVAESKGGRYVAAAAPTPQLRRFLLRAGFVAEGAASAGVVFHVTPE